ncbi:uncharacterized protein BT62DRAFT_938438 [Guyanagaster necrorhizus]|uniref:Uncharacterized protein n=1 Tax=Guyanagaster necrorhizus TaxID=856835 RepID=A0A9P7VG87_9AGAR|nr:uncharacterized protein BT62DRAFT_938438 [Guyanagaster necrorhizus MCA 3950]KAG7440007.1 hypothetical protein BT62DRAFT_938438 [Guyanagaster necrorhizus MCA 3950]
MVRASRKAPANLGKPITDFFFPKSAVQQSATASMGSSPNRTSRFSTRTEVKSKSVQFSTPVTPVGESISILTGRVGASTRESLATRGSLQNAAKSSKTLLSPSVLTRQHSRTPDMHAGRSVNNTKSPTPLSPSQHVTTKRKAKFDLDDLGADSKANDAVVYIPRSSTRPPNISAHIAPHDLPQTDRKRLRFSSPDTNTDVVPGSLSDEEEMTSEFLPQRDVNIAKPDVNQWRHGTTSPVPAEDAVADSEDASSPMFTPEESPFASRPATPPVFQQHTPPPTDVSSASALVESPTMVRTAKLIAAIKEQAWQKALSSPDMTIPEFKEDLDSSSDEDVLPTQLFAKGKGKAVQRDFSPSARPRRSLRSKVSPSSSRHDSISPPRASKRARIVPSRGLVMLATEAPKKKSVNPIDTLLREKKRGESSGGGAAGLLRAENALASGNVELPLAAENLALDTIRHQADLLNGSSTDPIDVGDMSFDQEGGQRLLGEKRGKAVLDILEGDKRKIEHIRMHQKYLGVPLWDDEPKDTTMDSASLHSFDEEDTPALKLLKDAIGKQNTAQAALLLESGIFLNVNSRKNPSVVPYLCHLALCFHEGSLSFAAFSALINIWYMPDCRACGVSFDSILAAITHLGAKPSVIESLGWSQPSEVAIPPARNEETLYRLVAMVTMSARSGGLIMEEIPDIFMILLLIALDPSNSSEILLDVVKAVDALCRSIAPGDSISKSIESRICSKVAKHALDLAPINKAHMISFISAGTGRAQRIARNIVHCVLTGTESISADIYSDLPPLTEIIDTILTSDIFNICDETDYVDLGFWTELLAVALSNIEGYVAQEMKHPPPIGSPSKSDKTHTVLQLVRQAIEDVHSRIDDTRAAHLDRTRTKLSLKKLSMRLAYQYKAAIDVQNKHIHQYFKKPE